MVWVKVKFLLLFSGLINFLFISAQDTILVFHPTATNIKTITTLSKGIMFPNKEENFHFMGVYHSNEKYDYALSQQYLDENPELESMFSLKEIDEKLSYDQLFQKNNCSGDFKTLFSSSIGAIFLGGPDIPPAIYKEPMHLLTEVTDPGRHYVEISALFHFLGSSSDPTFKAFLEEKPDYAIICICLGMQSLNVATGGSLIQDIPEIIYEIDTREELLSNPSTLHRNYYYDDPSDSINLTSYHFHPIQISRKTSFSKKMKMNKGSNPHVLSSHHQSIDRLGKGLIPAAWSADGEIIESVIHEKFPGVFGVQFHPEKIELYDETKNLYVSSDSTINFNSYIRNGGYDQFHFDFWRMIGESFNNSSKSDYR